MSGAEGARPPGPLGSALATLAVAAAVGALLGRFAVAGSGGSPGESAKPLTDESAAATAAALEAQVRKTPDSPELLTRLGATYLTRARETADPSYLSRAAEALGRSQALDGQRPATLTALALLNLARHDFPAALELGTRAHELDPASADPLGVVVDAHVELGQYDQAASAAQEMVDRRPSLASFSRVSYLRELHGDLAGAITAMSQAAVAGAGSPADVAYVEALLGDLYLLRGDVGRAEAAYLRALDAVDGFGGAEVGMARVAIAGEDFNAAIGRLEGAVSRVPQPSWVALLGDTYDAAGRREDAATQYALVRQIEALNRASGIAVDLELARFEADHAAKPGADPQSAVAMARTAVAARPTVFASDTLAWALRQAGRPAEALPHAREAVRLGTADGSLWYHLAVIEADLGNSDDAAMHLERALSMAPSLGIRDLAGARALGARLGVLARP